jgi:sigma-B regulation protein RsbU (phosphoserine phosphatase)
MTQDFAASLDVDTTLRKALARITRHVGAEGGAIFLLDDAGSELVCHASDGPVTLTGLRLKKTEGIVGRSVRTNTCEIVRDALNDPNFESRVDARTGFTTRSVLCAPLSVQDTCLGAIELVNKKGGNGLFGTRDLHLLQAMASSAALALLNARFAADLVRRERDRRELEIGAEIQRSLLPGRRPLPFPVMGVTRSARLVSGDFFDFLALADGRVAFAVGDVSGKGLQAAVLMAKTVSLYHCLAKSETSPGRLLRTLNEEICDTVTRGMFVTMVVGIYDPAAGTVRLANAGHEPPVLHRSDRTFLAFPASAPPIGILASAGAEDYPEEDIDVGPGTLYVFTDGLAEGLSGGTRPDDAGAGAERVKELIERNARQPMSTRLDTIVEAVTLYPPRDDITLLAIDGCMGGQGWHGGASTAPSQHLLSLRFPAAADRLKEVRAAVEDATRRCGCSAPCTRDVVMAIDEACQNIIRHAYGGNLGGEIVLEIERQEDQLVIWLRDFAPKIDESTIQSRDLDDLRPGGLGVHLIGQLMDETCFVPCPSGNTFRMVKRMR